jgi:hypothetical protein
MANNRQIPKLRNMAFDTLAKRGLFRTEFEMTNHSAVPVEILQNGVSCLVLDIAREQLLPRLLKAVINDDRNTVIAMLDLNPELLLISPLPDCVIENECTWQKFYAEDALKMSVKLKQLKMTELLLDYYHKLEQTDDVIESKNKALSAWKPYEIIADEILIPREYELLAESLIGVFREENFANGIPGENNIPRNIELSEQTESALVSLLDMLVPKQAVKLDECMDVELFLYAVYKAYVKHFDSFNYNWGKLEAFCIRVIGLIQTALHRETGEIFCEGLNDVATAMLSGKAKEISQRAKALKLEGGEDFYRISRVSRGGCGFEFLCGKFAGAPSMRALRSAGARVPGLVARLGKFMSSKNNKFSEHYAARAATASPTRANK